MNTKLEEFFKNQGLQPIGSLAHWGIKGMRWGIRRSDAELARGSADAVRAKETATTIKKSGTLSSVSDADLRHLVSRINLEKSYSDAVTVTKSSTAAKTHSSVRSLLGVGDTMNKAIGFANSPAGKLLASALGQKSTGRHVRR